MRTTRFILPLVALALCAMPAVALASSGGTTRRSSRTSPRTARSTVTTRRRSLRRPSRTRCSSSTAARAPSSPFSPNEARRPSRRRPQPARPSNLPFTGADVLLFVVVGGGLLAAGLVLRRFGRRDDEASA